MDNILQRMLAVDQEADAIVSQANEESERLHIECRRKVMEENAAFEQTVNEECDKLYKTRMADIEALRQGLLDEMDSRIASRRRTFADAVSKRCEQIAEVLMHPGYAVEEH